MADASKMGSESIPTERSRVAVVATAHASVALCVMDPTNPLGQMGLRFGPARTSSSAEPAWRNARAAQRRPAANSRSLLVAPQDRSTAVVAEPYASPRTTRGGSIHPSERVLDPSMV